MTSERRPGTAAIGAIQWLRVLPGALLTELVLFAIAVPLYLVPNGATLLLYIVPPACLAVPALFGFWVANRARSRFILHGALVGLVGALIYVAMTWGKALPTAYVVSHFLKVIGGALGGYLAQRKAEAA